ncbi:MAG: helix-hairpin-helix domain-containing protein [Bacteroidales bacterium]|nr:helix-hairpin-helix domain-containing protein [Bacteroidales bacterium]
MEGGMTRRRGYLWLSIVLLAATAGLLALQPGEREIPADNKAVSQSRQQASIPPPSDALTGIQYSSSQSHFARHSGYANASGQYPIRKKSPLVFELNEADSMDLVQLYNIGPTMARRILRYRAMLGGYCRLEQLKEVYGMDSARYADITPHLTVNPSLVVQLDINTASVDQLKRHPYLDYYQAKAIVRQRDVSGFYTGVADLLNIPIIDNETYNLIEPYLICNLQPNK